MLAVLQIPMPLPAAVTRLAALWPEDKPLFVVGGAVRDYAYFRFHGTKFDPKDYDLASQLTADEVVWLLRKNGIKHNAIGAAFGVIQAHIDGEDYEIASFRDEWYDPEAGDGRRPDEVRQGVSPKDDAARRDLYINALFYDIKAQEIRDYNDGEGFEDIRTHKVRPVGDPHLRFREDRLRVVRLVRFFCRYSEDNIIPRLDGNTVAAMMEWKHLPGISAERKLQEFLAGIKQARLPGMFLQNMFAFVPEPHKEANQEKNLSLMQAMFPELVLDPKGLDTNPYCRDPKAIFAWMLRRNSRGTLFHSKIGLGNRLKFPSSLTDDIEFLLSIYGWWKVNYAAELVPGLLRQRDKFVANLPPEEVEQYKRDRAAMIVNFCDFSEGTIDFDQVKHLWLYEPTVRAEEFMAKGLSGKDLGEAIRDGEVSRFADSWKTFEKNG